MANRCCGASFAFETRDRFTLLQHFIVEDVRPDSLDRYATGDEILIAREIDLAHRAASEAFLQQIPGRQQRRPRQSVLGVCLIFGARDYVVFITTFATWALAHIE
jgi:hypothetical protein